MMPGLGGKYEIKIEATTRPKADYLRDEYVALDLPVAPLLWRAKKSWWKVTTFPRMRWNPQYVGTWACRNLMTPKKDFWIAY